MVLKFSQSWKVVDTESLAELKGSKNDKVQVPVSSNYFRVLGMGRFLVLKGSLY